MSAIQLLCIRTMHLPQNYSVYAGHTYVKNDNHAECLCGGIVVPMLTIVGYFAKHCCKSCAYICDCEYLPYRKDCFIELNDPKEIPCNEIYEIKTEEAHNMLDTARRQSAVYQELTKLWREHHDKSSK